MQVPVGVRPRLEREDGAPRGCARAAAPAPADPPPRAPPQGVESAHSQQAEKQIGDPTIVWNFPVDATFETTEPFGWPQLSLQLFGPDFMGRDVVRGYGAVHVPTQAGHHEMYVKIFAPQSSSAFQSIQSTLMGTPPEFNNPKFATTGEARSVTRVQSTGTVKVCMDVVLVNMKALDLVS